LDEEYVLQRIADIVREECIKTPVLNLPVIP